MEYPDVECAMLDTSGVEEMGLFRYIVSETILGVEEVHGNSKGIDCIRICPF